MGALRPQPYRAVTVPHGIGAYQTMRSVSGKVPLAGAYAALLCFMLIYYARPEDWIPGLSHVPLAKVAAILAILALCSSLHHIRQRLPREVTLLAILIGQLFVASVLSEVWRTWSLKVTLEFTKVLLVVFVMAVSVNTLKRLRLLIFTQAASVAAIATVAIWKGHLLLGRLEGVLGGNYSDPNDLALAIAISAPLCVALMFTTKNKAAKVIWASTLFIMTYAVFLTGSRGGFLAFLVGACFCLLEFAIRGRRNYLLVIAALAAVALWQLSGDMVGGRLKGTFNEENNTAASYGSAQQRLYLLGKSIELTAEHPLFGVGPGDFDIVSGVWHTTHNTFTQMSAEAGLPAFFIYCLILWGGFKNLKAVKRHLPADGAALVFSSALRCSLAAYIAGSLFGSEAYQFFPYFLVAYTTALVSITRKLAQQPADAVAVRQTVLRSNYSAASVTSS